MKYEEQVERAREAIENWPDWMKNTAYFVGSENAPLPDDAEDHKIE